MRDDQNSPDQKDNQANNPDSSQKSQNEEKQKLTVEDMYGISDQKDKNQPQKQGGNVIFDKEQTIDTAQSSNQAELSEKLANAYQEGNIPPETQSTAETTTPSPDMAAPESALNPQVEPAQTEPQAAETQVPLAPTLEQPEKPLPPKKKPFKLIIGLFFLVLILGVLVYAALKYAGPGNKLLGQKGEITWWGLQFDEKDIDPLIKEYEDSHPEVKIKYIKQSTTDYKQRLESSLVQGAGPDIFEIHNTWPVMFNTYLSSMPSTVMSKDDFSNTFYPVVASDLTTDKGIVAIPINFDALTLYINDDLFALAGKTPPRTWDELRDLAKDFTQAQENGEIIQAGVPMGFTENIDYWPDIVGLMLIQNGASPAIPTDERAQAAIDYYKLFKTDRVWSDILPNSTSSFARGKVAMYFGPSRAAFDIARENAYLKFRTVSLPQLAKEKPTDPDYSYATYWVEGVWDRSRNKEMAWDFMKFMNSKEAFEKLNHSIKEESNLEIISPRLDMATIWTKDPILGSIVSLAPYAKSWYLAGNTYDSENGINSQVNSIYEEVISPKIEVGPKPLKEVANELSKVLSRYGIPVK